jgi:hypothetical protein
VPIILAAHTAVKGSNPASNNIAAVVIPIAAIDIKDSFNI